MERDYVKGFYKRELLQNGKFILYIDKIYFISVILSIRCSFCNRSLIIYDNEKFVKCTRILLIAIPI